MERTQVTIVGAGPAGLLLGLLLEREGVECRVLEARDRDYVEARVRAGLLEQGTVDLLTDLGVDSRLREQGYFHDAFEVRFAGERHLIPLRELTEGWGTWMYGQQEVVKDLIAMCERRGVPIEFEAVDVAIDGIESDRPTVSYRRGGREWVISSDAVAGCDGFHGVSRAALGDAITTYSETYPFAWLGILADAPPATMTELIYAHHANGFALHSFRSPELSRLYLQVPPDADPDDWSEDRIWDELARRFETDGWHLNTGPIRQKSITPMRCFVAEPMRRGMLFLAGDAAHIVPPTAAKGLNLAASDVSLLAAALVAHLVRGEDELLDRYSSTAMREVWQVQAFSWEMTNVFHHLPGEPYAGRVQEAQLRRLCSSPSYMKAFCDAYSGASRRGPARDQVRQPTDV
jgi:p-hydroxybenzoate 3-monooxygenase